MKMRVYKDSNGGSFPWFAQEADGTDWSFGTWREAISFAVGCYLWDKAAR